MTPEERSEMARAAINTRWSRPGARRKQAVASRSAMYRQLEKQVDPDGKLPADEREKLVQSALAARMARARAGRASRKAS